MIRFISCIQIARFLGKPVKPIAKAKNEDPAKINAIIHEVFVAPSNDNLKLSYLNFFEKKIKLKLPQPLKKPLL